MKSNATQRGKEKTTREWCERGGGAYVYTGNRGGYALTWEKKEGGVKSQFVNRREKPSWEKTTKKSRGNGRGRLEKSGLLQMEGGQSWGGPEGKMRTRGRGFSARGGGGLFCSTKKMGQA